MFELIYGLSMLQESSQFTEVRIWKGAVIGLQYPDHDLHPASQGKEPKRHVCQNGLYVPKLKSLYLISYELQKTQISVSYILRVTMCISARLPRIYSTGNVVFFCLPYYTKTSTIQMQKKERHDYD